jgi:zinc transporter ZupT
MEPSSVLWACCLFAVVASAAGVLPTVGRDRLPAPWLGWANSIAAGLMLGAAYALAVESLAGDGLQWAGGAFLGVLFVYATHRLAGTADLELNVLDHEVPDYGAKVWTVQALHSASEGVAIGVAAVIELRFGIFMAFVLAIHNVAEAMILSAVLRGRNTAAPRVAALVVAARSSQAVVALVVWALVAANPAALQVTLGYAMGTLVYLVMVELLPEAYRQAGYPSIALLTSLALGAIAFLNGVVL